MIDTVRVQWQGIRYDEGVRDWLLSEYKTPEFHSRWYDEGLPWQGATVQDTTFGTIQIKSNKQGNYLVAERSLPKFMYQENCRVLSTEEAEEGLTALVAGVEERFREWWDVPHPRDTAKVQRLDLCYQQQVPCSGEVFVHVARSLKSRKLVMHLDGLQMQQNRQELARWYDKGIESGDERYLNVVRHEEQLRRGKAGYLVEVNGERARFNVEACRDAMNRRYQGWEQLESYQLGTLLDEHGLKGAAAALLVVQPEYDRLFQQHLSNGTYYRLRNMALEARRRQSAVDLRLPDDAWHEPMVL